MLSCNLVIRHPPSRVRKKRGLRFSSANSPPGCGPARDFLSIMPRIRTLKPEHRQHRKVGPLCHVTYRLWVGMILEADDAGRLVCEAAQLAALIFGYHHDVTPALVEDSLRTLAQLKLIRLYVHEGTRYADFPSWADHQRINRVTPSKLPAYDASMSVHGGLTEDSLLIGKEGKGTERKGSEGIKTGGDAAPPPAGDHPIREFLGFYQERFEARFGGKPNVQGGKDAKLVQGLLRRYGGEVLRRYLLAFLESDDEFIQRSGYTLGVFSVCLNKVIVQGGNGPRLMPRTQANIAALRRFVSNLQGGPA